MKQSVLFVQGAGDGAYDEDKHLVESLRRVLGSCFDVRYPAMPDEDNASYAQWRQAIEREMTGVAESVAIVGHSIGASVVIKWLGERADGKALAGVFLIACPFWGGDGWRYEGYEALALPSGLAARLPPGLPIFLYHCHDDAIVPFSHLALYSQALPQATIRALAEGGHQLNNDLTVVARDIEALT